MKYVLKNEALTVEVSSLGGQLQSIRDKSGKEFLWQGDPKYWKGRSPELFPFIGRLMDKTYELDGEKHTINLHGFLRDLELECTERSEHRLTLSLRDNEQTRQVYPRAFLASLIRELEGNTLLITFRVENRDEKPMYFAYGGHPGFFVPMEEGKSFEDYYLEFPEACRPMRVKFSERALVDTMDTPYDLEDGRRLRLRHDLFDNDAIVLHGMDRSVRLTCGSGPAVTVRFPQMPYVGFWHMPHTDAPYVCIEPWSSIPGRDGVTEQFEAKEDLISLEPGGVYENRWSITIEG